MKFALVKNVSFKLENNLNEISKDEIRTRFNTGVEYYEFDGTKDLFQQMNQLMGCGSMLELINCAYDSESVIQSVYTENDTNTEQKVIFFKRKIRVGDSYTFLEFDPNAQDLYQYENITQEDLTNLLYNKRVNTGILLCADGNVDQIEYLLNDAIDDNYGSIQYFDKSKIMQNAKFLHLINIMQKLKDETNDTIDETTFNERMNEQMDKFNCTHLYNQRDLGFGIFNCYYPVFGSQINHTMSRLLGEQVYGDVIITLETNLNNDERLLNLDTKLFQLILETISNPNFVPKNEHYFNIYYELL